MKTLVKLIRYAAVSAVSTVTALTLLGLLVGLAGAPAGWSNAFATAVATVPSFELNRRWVWGAQAGRSLVRQAAPFFALSMSGLVLSTLNVHIAATWATSHGWNRLARTLVAQAANLGTFGVLWVFQYVLCDRLLFRSSPMQVDGTIYSGVTSRSYHFPLNDEEPPGPPSSEKPWGVPASPLRTPDRPDTSGRPGPVPHLPLG